MCETLDTMITLRPEPGPKAAGGSSVWAGYCLRLIALTVAIALININPANANHNSKSELKLYAYNLMSWSQFECYNWLILKESRWDFRARNGSHYGVGQMRNRMVLKLNGRQQIDMHLRYLAKRYKGDSCLALKHFDRYGWH